MKYPVVIGLSSLMLSGGAIAAYSIGLPSDTVQLLTEDGAPSQSDVLPRTDRLPHDVVLVAQSAPSSADQGQARSSVAKSAPLPADLSALRYFAGRGDNVRLEAEIARLKALYPGWTPPENPLADLREGDPQLDAMWKLFGEQRFDDLRKAIAERQKADSSWQVPEDLAAMLKQVDARQSLATASALKQYNTVIETASLNPSLLTCKDVDVLWMVAEAFAKTDRPERSFDAYRYILTNCTGLPERLATIQKASLLLSPTIVDQLLAMERPDVAGKPEFDSLRDDLARRFVSDAAEKPDSSVPTIWLERLKKLGETEQRASDALLLGWYSFRHGATSEAEKWFRIAHDKQDSASSAQGLALVLQARKDFASAENVMYPWRDNSDEAKQAYLAAATNLLAQEPPIVVASDVLQRIATETALAKNADTAQQFGWYARAFQQPQLALKWFSLAVSWKPDDEPSAYGLAITADELKMPAEVSRLQTLWAGRSMRIAALGERKRTTVTPVTSNGGRVSSKAGEAGRSYPSAVRQTRAQTSCAVTMAARNLSPEESLAQGWCLMNANRAPEAVEAFDSASKSAETKVRSDAAYGKSLAYLRMGLINNAAFAATNRDLDSAKATELQVALLADRAVASFQARRYSETINLLDRRARLASERVDLMVLRGYVYLNLKRYGDAKRVFQSLAAIGNRDGVKGLADVREAISPGHSG